LAASSSSSSSELVVVLTDFCVAPQLLAVAVEFALQLPLQAWVGD
jgi:hypothetical protein